METKDNTIYYGVYSDIGFGVFTSLELAKAKTASAKDWHYHKFSNYRYAGLYAMTGYNGYHYALQQPVYKNTPDPYEINILYS